MHIIVIGYHQIPYQMTGNELFVYLFICNVLLSAFCLIG